MTELKLTIDLVPRTSWYNNVRAVLSSTQWNALRGVVADRAYGICQICGAEGRDCHEIWRYNEKTGIRTLEGMIHLCESCHLVKHIGFARVKGRYEEAFKHFMKVNKLKKRQAEEYVGEAFARWRQRNQRDWKTDLSLLKRYGIDVEKLQKENAK